MTGADTIDVYYDRATSASTTIPYPVWKRVRYGAITGPGALRGARYRVPWRTDRKGPIMLMLNGSANRDEARYPEGERFDIRSGGGHLSFVQGLQFCMGSAPARMQARVALPEVLKR